MSKESSPGSEPAGLSRRGLLGAVGAGVALAGAGVVVGRVTAPESTTPHADVVEFRGAHQAGIVTPAQDRLHFVAFDVLTDSRDELVAMLKQWTEVAERMTRGEETYPDGAVGGAQYAPPRDTGEALGLAPSQLTVTIGFGPALFDRFGLADRKPAVLADLQHFPGEILDPTLSGGDIAIQACANDPQVAVHAVRNLARLGTGTVAVKWSQLGFGRTSSTSCGCSVVAHRSPTPRARSWCGSRAGWCRRWMPTCSLRSRNCANDAGDAAQPDGVQGRDQQPQG